MNPNRSLVATAFRKGINRGDASVLGYHGTSVQALEEAMRTGGLPVTRGAGGVFGGPAYKGVIYGIHLVPNHLNPVVKEMEFRNQPFDDPFDDALRWARFVAERHHIMKSRGLDLGRITHHRAADDIMNLVEPERATRGMKLLQSEPGSIRAGVVLAISEEAAKRFRIMQGGDGNDINVMTKSLPLGLVTGIEPADDAAFHWLDTLDNTTESFKSWLAYKENPVLQSAARFLSRQRMKLELRYGKKRADRIIAAMVISGMAPLPGAQIAALLAMLGISETDRVLGRINPEELELLERP